MKMFLSVFVLILFTTISCHSTDSVSAVATSFSESILQGRVTKSKLYCTPETQMNVTIAGNLIKGFSFINEISFKSKVTDIEHISDDEAVVTVEITSSKLQNPMQFDLVTYKIEDEWRVHFTYDTVEVIINILKSIN